MELFNPFEMIVIASIIILVYFFTILHLVKTPLRNINKIVWGIVILILPGLGIVFYWLWVLLISNKSKRNLNQESL